MSSTPHIPADLQTSAAISSTLQVGGDIAAGDDINSADDIAAGDVLLRSRPYVSVLHREHRYNRCDTCFRPLPPSPLLCPSCQTVSYCNQACLHLQGWIHGKECLALSSAPRASDTARLMIRLIIRVKDDGDGDGEVVPGLGYRRKIGQLLSHKEQIVEDQQRFDKIGKSYQELQRMEFDGLPEFCDFVELFGKVFVNGFSVNDVYNKHVATALYLAPSIIDHSCKPNALWTFEGDTIVIRALEEIKDFCMSKVRISYMDLMNEREYRVDHLLKNYYFICTCSQCEDMESELRFHSIWCPYCHGQTCFRITARVSCDLCGETFNEELIQKYKETCEKLKACLKGLILSVPMVLECVEEMIISCFLHPDNIYYVKSVKMAFEECYNSKRFEEALRYGTLAVNSYKKYQHVNVSAFIQILIKLAKVEIKLNTSNDIPKSHLEEAKHITGIFYGKQNELYQNIDQLLSSL